VQGRASTSARHVDVWLAALSRIDPGGFDEAGGLVAITGLERLKRAAAAAQARLSVRVEELAETPGVWSIHPRAG
jgi:hypothetical protein